jgi:hypothetical protein
VGSALSGYPLASMIIAGAITTALIAVIYWYDLRHGGRTRGGDEGAAREGDAASG